MGFLSLEALFLLLRVNLQEDTSNSPDTHDQYLVPYMLSVAIHLIPFLFPFLFLAKTTQLRREFLFGCPISQFGVITSSEDCVQIQVLSLQCIQHNPARVSCWIIIIARTTIDLLVVDKLPIILGTKGINFLHCN